jgi:hypothetical protein
VKALLHRLLAEGGDDNRALLTAPGGWIVVRGARGGDGLSVVAMSGRHAAARLSDDQMRALYGAGLTHRNAAEPVSASVADAAQAAALSQRVLEQAFGLPQHAAPTVKLRLSTRPTVTNPAVNEAMKTLAGDREQAARHALYMVLTQARLLVALVEDPAANPDAPVTLRSVGAPDAPIEAVAYTDAGTRDRHDPTGQPVCELTADELFPLLRMQGASALQLNPAGPIGGSLWRHELLTIEDGLKRLRSMGR